MLAKATKTPELELDREDCETLGGAIEKVMSHYNLKTTQKAVDWFTLVGVCSMMYGGKFMAASERKKAEKKAAQENAHAANSQFGL